MKRRKLVVISPSTRQGPTPKPWHNLTASFRHRDRGIHPGRVQMG